MEGEDVTQRSVCTRLPFAFTNLAVNLHSFVCVCGCGCRIMDRREGEREGGRERDKGGGERGATDGRTGKGLIKTDKMMDSNRHRDDERERERGRES